MGLCNCNAIRACAFWVNALCLHISACYFLRTFFFEYFLTARLKGHLETTGLSLWIQLLSTGEWCTCRRTALLTSILPDHTGSVPGLSLARTGTSSFMALQTEILGHDLGDFHQQAIVSELCSPESAQKLVVSTCLSNSLLHSTTIPPLATASCPFSSSASLFPLCTYSSLRIVILCHPI
jgi:hypothetical protein